MTTTDSSRSGEQSACPVVSVAILAYNHEAYIEKAVSSVICQRTSFPCEILIADDCSTDKTPAFLNRLERQFPGRLTLLPRPHNLGLSANLQDCRERARGRYLAILEGDDHWIDPLKLQKQYDAMESHTDWSMCFGSCRVFYEGDSQPERMVPTPPPTQPLVLDDFLNASQVQTMSSAMYRQGVVTRMPPWHEKLRLGDWALHIMHAQAGPVGFLPDVLTAYRVHPRGLWSGLQTFRQWEEMLALFGYLESHFDEPLSAKMREARSRFVAMFSDRVADLEKVERRYLLLRLDRVAALWRKVRGKP